MNSAVILVLVAYITIQITALKATGIGEGFLLSSNFYAPSSFSRIRRQANNEDDIKCSSILAKAICSSSYTQNLLNAISKCGDRAISAINTGEYSCRRNSNGQYCTEVYSTGYVFDNCSHSSSCSAGCFKALMDAGCCLNDGSGYYDDFFTTCRLPLPSPCEKSGIQVPTITEDRSCSSQLDFQQTTFISHCDNSQPLIRALGRENICKNISDLYRDQCASRNGQYCAIQLNLTSLNGHSAGLYTLATAAGHCPSTTTCSLQCNISLTTARNTVGCCFQLVNNTDLSTQNFSTTIFSSSLWNACGIPLVSRCGAAPIYALYSFMIFFIASITLLLQN